MRVRAITLAFFGVVVVSGCAQASTLSDKVAGPPGFPPAAAAHTLTKSRAFADGIKFQLPPVAAVPAVSAQTAYAACSSDGICSTDSAPDIEVASVTIPDIVEPDDGSKVESRLAYILTWTSVPCHAAGPAPAGKGTCTFYNIVDSKTGKTLYSMQMGE